MAAYSLPGGNATLALKKVNFGIIFLNPESNTRLRPILTDPSRFAHCAGAAFRLVAVLPTSQCRVPVSRARARHNNLSNSASNAAMILSGSGASPRSVSSPTFTCPP